MCSYSFSPKNIEWRGLSTLHTQQALPLGGVYVNHLSVPGSVADMHNLNKIDIKNHTFIANGENKLHGLGLHSLGH